MKRTVKDIMEYIKTFPEDSIVTVYEGEDCGIVIKDKSKNEIGFISTED